MEDERIEITLEDTEDITIELDDGIYVFGNIKVGNTVTGAPGTNAKVTNRGTESSPVLEFTIPRGEDGEGYTAGKGIQISEDRVISTTSTADNFLWENIDHRPASITGKYEDLEGKPSINDIELIGNKSFEDLNLKSLTNSDIEKLFK